jgi:L-ascorbate metabolism protein UlaG (beta-lactamase superfamily)
MKIKKIGHCCLLIQTAGVTLLTDPGIFTAEQNSLTGIDAVLITHEHSDHLHVESVKEVLKNNPRAQVITNSGVGKILAAEGIPYTLLEGTAAMEVKGVALEAADGRHEEIFEEMGQVQATGYLIGGEFFLPGDSFHNPGKEVRILALPVAGPWCRLPDALRFAIAVKPEKAFPVHDAMIKEEFGAMLQSMPAGILAPHGIEFIAMKAGEEKEF